MSSLKPITAAPRTAVLTSADLSFRQRVRDTLAGLRWEVREATGGAEALAYLDAAPADVLIADFSSGTASATAQSDLASLSQSLNYVDQERAVIDNSINRLTASSNYASSESVQLQSAQDTLLQTDTAQVATQLNSTETQQAALTQVIAAIDQQGTLFQAL
jgi:flagellin-like hook-associated protein FlgL